MDFVNVMLSAIQFSNLLTILIVAIGLGLVIFFHELGHFLVAKWCGVYVERFSIGFGAPIFGFKWGETEYSFGWLPFGGYVKMLGQDDMDPAQMTDEQVAVNPRSYTSKTVLQRMAIISAGVIMNIITGTIFFVLVFTWGIEKVDSVAGYVQVGMPAWKNGIRTGDRITSINGRSVQDFDDITRRTTLSRGPITVGGHHDDGTTYEVSVQPETSGIRKIIGVGPARSLNVIDSSIPGASVASVGTAASKAGFELGDRITAINGKPVETTAELLAVLNEKAAESVEMTVLRTPTGGKAEEATVTVPAEPFMELGLKMGMGKVVALQKGSVAEEAGLQIGDRIAKVNGQDVGVAIDPFRLTEIFSANAGETVKVTITREVPGSSQETLEISLVPEHRAAWSEPPVAEGSPLSIPSIGLAYHLVPTILSVTEGSPAEGKINPRDTITRIDLVPVAGTGRDLLGEKSLSFDIDEKNWAHAYWLLQEYGRTRTVKLKVKPSTAEPERIVELQPVPSQEWFLPTLRGLNLAYLETNHKASDLGQAFTMGAQYALNSMEDIYLTLRGLFMRDISPKGLSGPIGIAKLAYTFASFSLTHFVLFLGIISINLAVINFLPIPVLDGGHMVFLLWEGIFRRKPSEAVVATATYFGLAFVLGLFVFVIYLDLFVSKI
ncbi:MAG TPA: RIP metalloprotease RseP [Planctomicrobium sp.]|nr:RIP metalloprotease RseP [Planctomicrobium sp.]